MAIFHERTTEGAIPRGRSISASQKVWTPAQVSSLSYVTTSSPVRWFSQTLGAATTTSPSRATRTSRRISPKAETRPMLSCPASTELRRCSNAGCLEITKALPFGSCPTQGHVSDPKRLLRASGWLQTILPETMFSTGSAFARISYPP